MHGVTERQARRVLAALEDRMVEVGLRLHPDKTKIVYCQDGKRRHAFEHTSFTFLGYTFRPRGARAKDGRMFVSFAPAISRDALAKIGREVRSWRLHLPYRSILRRARGVGESHCAGLHAVTTARSTGRHCIPFLTRVVPGTGDISCGPNASGRR